MSTHINNISTELSHYLRQIGEPEQAILKKLREQTNQHRLGKMAIAPEQAALLTWLARLLKVEKYLEIGVFTGYSTTAMALALPQYAKITACDINVTFTDIAKEYWQQAGIADKITLCLQPALITLGELIAQGKSGSYDMALIDADKSPTPQYFERCLQLVRSGGLIAIDNILLNGRVLHPANDASPASLKILQDFNASLPYDDRITPLTLPIGDGLTLILKK